MSLQPIQSISNISSTQITPMASFAIRQTDQAWKRNQVLVERSKRTLPNRGVIVVEDWGNFTANTLGNRTPSPNIQTSSTPVIGPRSLVRARIDTVRWLLKTDIRKSYLIGSPFRQLRFNQLRFSDADCIKIGNEFLNSTDVRTRENFFFLESHQWALNFGEKNLIQKENEKPRLQAYNQLAQATFTPFPIASRFSTREEVFKYFDRNKELFVQAHILTILRNSKLPYLDFVTSCQSAWKVTSFAAVFKNSEGDLYPKVFSFVNNPFICRTPSDEFILILPNGRVFNYRDTPSEGSGRPWAAIAAGLGLFSLSNQIIEREGKRYSFFYWEGSHEEVPSEDRKSIKDYVEKGVRTYFIEDFNAEKNGPDAQTAFQAIASRLIPNNQARPAHIEEDSFDLLLALSMGDISVSADTLVNITTKTRGVRGSKRIQIALQIALQIAFSDRMQNDSLENFIVPSFDPNNIEAIVARNVAEGFSVIRGIQQVAFRYPTASQALLTEGESSSSAPSLWESSTPAPEITSFSPSLQTADSGSPIDTPSNYSLPFTSGSLLNAPVTVMRLCGLEGLAAEQQFAIREDIFDAFFNPYAEPHELSRAMTLFRLEANLWAAGQHLSEEKILTAYRDFLLPSIEPLQLRARTDMKNLHPEGSSALEIDYFQQYLDYFGENAAPFIQAEVMRIFHNSQMQISEFLADCQAAQVITTFAAEGVETARSEVSGFGIQFYSPIICQTLLGRSVLICPNGKLTFLPNPLPTGRLLHEQIAQGLGLGELQNHQSFKNWSANSQNIDSFSIKEEVYERVRKAFEIDLVRTAGLFKNAQINYADFGANCKSVWTVEIANSTEISEESGFGIYPFSLMVCKMQSGRFVAIRPNGGLFSYDENPIVREMPNATSVLSALALDTSKEIEIRAEKLSSATPFSIQREVKRRIGESIRGLPEKTLSQEVLQIGSLFYQTLTQVAQDPLYEPERKELNPTTLVQPFLTGTQNATMGNFSFLDFRAVDLFSLSLPKREIPEERTRFVVPKFLAKNIASISTDQWIKLHLDVLSFALPSLQQGAGSLNASFVSREKWSFPKDSLYGVAVEAMSYLLKPFGDANFWDPFKLLAVRNQLLDSRFPDTATALVHLESLVAAKYTMQPLVSKYQASITRLQNALLTSRFSDANPARMEETLRKLQIVKARENSANEKLYNQCKGAAYLEQLETNPALSLVKKPVNIENDQSPSLFQNTSIPHARMLTAKEFLPGETFNQLSEIEHYNLISSALDPNAEGYDEQAAQAITKIEARNMGRLLSPNLTATESEEVYFRKLSHFTSPPEPLEFLTRVQLAEKRIDERYPNKNYDMTVLDELALSIGISYSPSRTREELVQQELNYGGSSINGLDKAYYEQFSNFFEKNVEKLKEMRADYSFEKAKLEHPKLDYTDFIRNVKRAWIIKDFAHRYCGARLFATVCTQESRERFKIPSSGINIFPAQAVIFESANGIFGMVQPNGNLFIYPDSPLKSDGKLDIFKVEAGFDFSSEEKQRADTVRGLQGMYMDEESVPPQPLKIFMEEIQKKVIQTDIRKMKNENYGKTGFQKFFFSVVPFLKLGMDKTNDKDAEVDVTDVIVDSIDCVFTLFTAGIPLFKVTGATVRAVKTAAKGLKGIAKTRAVIKTAWKTFSTSKHTVLFGKELVDFVIPIPTAVDLLKLGDKIFLAAKKKAVKLLLNKSDELLQAKGLKPIAALNTRCRRAPGCPTALSKQEATQLAEALSKDERPLKDTIFEQARKLIFSKLRETVNQTPAAKKIEELRTQFNSHRKLNKKKQVQTIPKNKKPTDDQIETYQKLGNALVKQEKILFSTAEKIFKKGLQENLKAIPPAERHLYISDFPKIKLELDETEDAMRGVNPRILISEDTSTGLQPDNISYMLRFIQSVIEKSRAPSHKVAYKINIRDLQAKLDYVGFEKAAARGTQPPMVYVGEPPVAIEYRAITNFLKNDVLPNLGGNQERELAKLVGEFLRTGRAPDVPNVNKQELKEMLSAFATISNIADESRTAGAGSALDAIIADLIKSSEASSTLLKVNRGDTTHRLTFTEIFNGDDSRLTYLANYVRTNGKAGMAKFRQVFKTSDERIKKRLSEEGVDTTDYTSADERSTQIGLNPILLSSPLKKKARTSKRVIPGVQERQTDAVTEESAFDGQDELEGGTGKKILAGSFIALTTGASGLAVGAAVGVAVVASAAVLIKVICYARDRFKQKRANPQPEHLALLSMNRVN